MKELSVCSGEQLVAKTTPNGDGTASSFQTLAKKQQVNRMKFYRLRREGKFFPVVPPTFVQAAT